VITQLLLPRLAQGRGRALSAGVGLLGAVGALLVAATVVLPDVAVRLAGGAAYASLADHAVWFAAVGALYAVAFFLLNARIAAGVRRPAVPLWISLGALVTALLTLRPSTVGQTIAISLGAAALATVATGAAVWRDRQRGGTVFVTEP
jgi:hypothetical protein